MAKKTDRDLFEGSTMTFGEHLEELRICLTKALLALMLCSVVGFFVSK
jgi:sec-independent protein translocase protein TatC